MDLIRGCHKAHGSRIRAYARYRGMLAKTDPIDARLLAEFGLQTKDLRLYRPPRPEQAGLRRFKSRRDDIQQLLQAEKNRLEYTDDKVVAASIDAVVKTLERQLARIEAEIAAPIDSDGELGTRARLLTSVIGIGRIATVTLLADLPELGRLMRGEAAMLTGLAPINKDSGQARAPRRIEAGRAQVRRCLYMAAVVAIRHNPILSAFAKRLTQDGKPFKVVITAVMRKLIVILNAIMRDRQPWKHAKTA
ncbi:MAG: IS110 family transposase [Hyphomicrobiaceae bacterium]